jgi:DNA-3-methyladenine glycosylase
VTAFDFARPSIDVARDLLGALVTVHGVTVRLTETEAYGGPDDPASHAAAKGRRPDTAALFAAPGTLYCYLSYGVHICGNLVAGPPGLGAAVLLRAGEVVDGLDLARRRRWGPSAAKPDATLARGPGNLGRALGLTLADSGLAVGAALAVTPRSATPAIAAGPRVGVTLAHEQPWRFWIKDDPTVSAYKRSPRITLSLRA